MAELSRGGGATSPAHFVLIPWLAQGHLIPMIDIARLLSSHDAVVTFITTPANASRVSATLSRLPVRLFTLPFPPSSHSGLPDACENLDSLPSRHLARNFYNAAKFLQTPLHRLLRHQLSPPPSCIIAGIGFPWLHDVARDLGLPRLIFQGFSCFSLLSSRNLSVHKTHETVTSPSDPFPIPFLPSGHDILITKPQLPRSFDSSSKFYDIYQELQAGEASADGEVVNSFEELEPGYADGFAKATGKKVWVIGPVSLSTDEKRDIAARGNRAFIDEQECMRWLDAKAPGSVIYVSFGSVGRLPAPQLAELGAGLEASKRPFVWVVKAEEEPPEFEEEKTKERCLLIRGWAPQVMILRHRAVGGFVTHCGWNSALEAVAAGVPVVTWPLGADQFLNEKLVVEVLGFGVSVGATAKPEGGDAEDNKYGVVVEQLVKREMVKEAIEGVMGGGEEAEKRRKRAKELGEMALRAVKQGGSSFTNLDLLVQSYVRTR